MPSRRKLLRQIYTTTIPESETDERPLREWVRSLPKPTAILVAPRGSTRTLAPGKVLVSRAKEFIAKNADRPLTIGDVVAFSHVSQRLLFLRFKEFSDKSIQETINAERIRHFCKRLRTGGGTIRDIAASCGFGNMTTLRSLFSSAIGMTIRAWRKANG